MPGSATPRNPSAGSSVQSRRRLGTLRKSSSKRNSASLSRDGSVSFSAFGAGSGNPLTPPIIQVGEGDDEAKIVVDVKSAAGKKHDFRLGSGKSSRKERPPGLTRSRGATRSPPNSAFFSSVTKRFPLDHAKRWSPPPFPNVSSWSSDFPSKSELSSSLSLIHGTPGQRLLNQLNATPSHGTQLSLPNAGNAPSQSINHIAGTGSHEATNRGVRLTSASAPNLTALASVSGSASSGNKSSVSSVKDSGSGQSLLKEENLGWSEEEVEEEAPFLSFAEMSIAISRWNHAVESRSLYNDAKRPVLRSASLTGEATKNESARGDARSVSVGPSLATTTRLEGRIHEKSRIGRAYGQKKTQKNCLKTIPSGGVKSSFFGDSVNQQGSSSSPAKSMNSQTRKVPCPALRGSSSVESGGGGGGEGTDNDPSQNVGRLASERLKDQEWESQLSSEMKKIYRHFKSYDETPRLRRGGTYQDLLLPSKLRRQSMNRTQLDEERVIEGITDGKVITKSVAFNIRQLPKESGLNFGENDADQLGGDAESRLIIYGVKSAPPLSDPASLDKLYRRHIARYYARSATQYGEIDDSMFPEMPGLPPAAESPFLNDARNKQVWEWLNKDFCKTKLDYFLSLCS